MNKPKMLEHQEHSLRMILDHAPNPVSLRTKGGHIQIMTKGSGTVLIHILVSHYENGALIATYSIVFTEFDHMIAYLIANRIIYQPERKITK